MHVLICSIGNQQYAFDLSFIERVFAAVEITPLPHAPEWILGAIRIHGEVFPVINTHRLLGFPYGDLDIDDHFILCHSGDRRVILRVDRVQKVKHIEEKNLELMSEILPGEEAVQYVIKEDIQITFVLNLDKLLPNIQLALI